MKRLFFAVILATLAFTSCQKVMEVFDGVPLPPGVDTNKYITKDTGCTLLAQSGSFVGEEPRSQVSGFRKVINSTTGLVDSLITANGGLFEIDSFFYVFEYFSDTLIHLSGVVKTYNRLNDMHLWQFETANELNLDIHLNTSGRVTSTTFGPAVAVVFNYDHGRLESVDFPTEAAPYAHVAFTYDDHNNLTKFVRGDANNNTTYTFEYDLSHAALSQIYTPVAPFDLYEIMGWIPIAPHNLRTRAKVVLHDANSGNQETVLSDITYSDHVLNNFNALQRFDAHVPAVPYDVTVTNTLECAINRSGHLPD
jgi:hypothetical protein